MYERTRVYQDVYRFGTAGRGPRVCVEGLRTCSGAAGLERAPCQFNWLSAGNDLYEGNCERAEMQIQPVRYLASSSFFFFFFSYVL
jgi:hypothetical protein